MDCTWTRIENADRILYSLNNERSLLEYRRDLGHSGLEDRIEAVSDRILGVFDDPSLKEAIRSCRGEAPAEYPWAARKLAIVRPKAALAAIDRSRALRNTAGEIARVTRHPEMSRLTSTLSSGDRAERRLALEHIAAIHAGAEPLCRELARGANELAREAGFEGYAEAKLAWEGLTVDGMVSQFARWREDHLPVWRRVLTRASEGLGHKIEAHDLLHVMTRTGRDREDLFPRGGATRFLRGILTRMGTGLDDLPISIEHHDIPFSGACYRVMPGEDVRILLSSRLSGFAAYFYLLHEFGHGIYYCCCPRGSELLLDNHLAREIMADLWTQFLKERSCLVEVLGLTGDLAGEVIRVRTEREALRLFFYLRDAMFTLEVLRRPEAPFRETWQKVSNRWLGIDDGSGAFEVLDFLHPLDMKSYIYAQEVSRSAFLSIPLKPGAEVLSTPGALDTMRTRFYQPGNTVDWQVRLGLGGA